MPEQTRNTMRNQSDLTGALDRLGIRWRIVGEGDDAVLVFVLKGSNAKGCEKYRVTIFVISYSNTERDPFLFQCLNASYNGRTIGEDAVTLEEHESRHTLTRLIGKIQSLLQVHGFEILPTQKQLDDALIARAVLPKLPKPETAEETTYVTA